MKITKRTIQAIKRYTAKLYNGEYLLIDYMMLEHDNRIIVIAKNTKLKHEFLHCPTETISFNRIDGKWNWGCRISSFTSTHQQKRFEENHGRLCIYDRYEEMMNE